MDIVAQRKFREAFLTAKQLEASVLYMTEHIGKFLKRRERVLICLPDTYGSIGWIIGQAVERCEGVPIFLGEDRRWKTMIRTAFSSRCGTIVTEPLLLLGLSKLAKNMGVPLFVRNAILVGYPCMSWMRDGMERGLDCRTYGCFDPAGVVAGFVSHDEQILWIRSDIVDAYTRDEQGNRLPDGESGEVVLASRLDPAVIIAMGHPGRITRTSGKNGEEIIGLFDMSVGQKLNPDIARLSGHLHRWTSILDCKVTRGDYGLELEIVTFPGEKLPKLPSCARQVVRPWDPETEIPLYQVYR